MNAWFSRRNRKPLVLRGARQVGKTHLVRRWAQGRGLVELNLEREPALHACFKGNDPKTILRRVEAATGRIVRADGEHVLFLDELQAAPELLAKLRWFAEELPRLPVIAAGSLLDFTLADHAFSMPVGRISYLHLEPMGFFEFLEALGESKLASALDAFSVGDDVIDVLHDKLVALFREWLLVGDFSGAGRFGRFTQSLSLAELNRLVQDRLRQSEVQFVGDPSQKIETLGIACGAAAEFLRDAHRVGCQALLTGEARFHACLEARELRMALILPGHYATERPAMENLAARLASQFPGLVATASEKERDPLNTVRTRSIETR